MKQLQRKVTLLVWPLLALEADSEAENMSLSRVKTAPRIAIIMMVSHCETIMQLHDVTPAHATSKPKIIFGLDSVTWSHDDDGHCDKVRLGVGNCKNRIDNDTFRNASIWSFFCHQIPILAHDFQCGSLHPMLSQLDALNDSQTTLVANSTTCWICCWNLLNRLDLSKVFKANSASGPRGRWSRGSPPSLAFYTHYDIRCHWVYDCSWLQVVNHSESYARPTWIQFKLIVGI